LAGARELMAAAERDMERYPGLASFWLIGAHQYLRVVALAQKAQEAA